MNLAPILAIIAVLLIAVLLIAGGGFGHRWPVAIVRYAVLALAALVLLGAATAELSDTETRR